MYWICVSHMEICRCRLILFPTEFIIWSFSVLLLLCNWIADGGGGGISGELVFQFAAF